jgi:integral membrane protein
MPEPKVASFPKIRGALKFYQVASVITGVMLLLLLAEMILKYSPTHLELFAGGSGGLLWFAPVIVGDGCQWYSLFFPGGMGCDLVSAGNGMNLSLFILVAHGWFYVVYLFACFRLWSLMRWTFPRFIMLALGGVIPALSFIMETKVSREVKAYLASREAGVPSAPQTQEAAR